LWCTRDRQDKTKGDLSALRAISLHFAPPTIVSSHHFLQQSRFLQTGSIHSPETIMLHQILTRTPIYVWAILAFLILRGVLAMRTREIALNKLFIIPIVMLMLSLQDIAAKFGMSGLPVIMWTLAAGATTALMWQFCAPRVTPAATPGRVIVRGSKLPLALLLAIFVTKYVATIVVAVQPHLRHDTLFMVAICALFGVFNGYFLGHLARDLRAYQGFASQPGLAAQAI
jgi:hypothetical protein